jgi:hypothetical protein
MMLIVRFYNGDRLELINEYGTSAISVAWVLMGIKNDELVHVINNVP